MKTAGKWCDRNDSIFIAHPCTVLWNKNKTVDSLQSFSQVCVKLGKNVVSLTKCTEDKRVRNWERAVWNLRPDAFTSVRGNVTAIFFVYLQSYLTEKGLVHRDLAARNILVGHGKRLKIGDFGLMRQLYREVYEVQKGKKLPVKWMAPESIFEEIFTVKSDV